MATRTARNNAPKPIDLASAFVDAPESTRGRKLDTAAREVAQNVHSQGMKVAKLNRKGTGKVYSLPLSVIEQLGCSFTIFRAYFAENGINVKVSKSADDVVSVTLPLV